MCHDLVIEANMPDHDCRHEYVYAYGKGFVASKFHQGVVKALMEEHDVKRNDPCFCGSTRKFKKCCGRPRNAAEIQEMINERLEKLPRRIPDGCADVSV